MKYEMLEELERMTRRVATTMRPAPVWPIVTDGLGL